MDQVMSSVINLDIPGALNALKTIPTKSFLFYGVLFTIHVYVVNEAEKAAGSLIRLDGCDDPDSDDCEELFSLHFLFAMMCLFLLTRRLNLEHGCFKGCFRA